MELHNYMQCLEPCANGLGVGLHLLLVSLSWLGKSPVVQESYASSPKPEVFFFV